jgi:hypothetical protein
MFRYAALFGGIISLMLLVANINEMAIPTTYSTTLWSSSRPDARRLSVGARSKDLF